MTTATGIREDQAVARRQCEARSVALVANAWVIAAVAFACRIAYMLVLRTWAFQSDYNHFRFGFETGSIARSIAAGEGFSSPFRNLSTGPTAWIAPVYPYICAAVFKVFGIFSPASAIAILTINCFVSALTTVLLYRVAERVFGRATAVVAAWSWAVVPYFMCWPASWAWDIPFSALFMTALTLLALELPFSRPGKWMKFGAIGGLAMLTNPAVMTILPMASIWAWLRSGPRRIAARNVLLAAIICIAVISPWLIRNRVVLGKWVFLRDNFVFEFSIGNFPGGSGMAWSGFHPARNDNVMREYTSKGEIAFLQSRSHYPKMWVTEHTREFAAQTVHRFTAFWDGTSQLWSKMPGDIWTPLPFFIVTVLALLGCVLAIGNGLAAGWLLGLTCLLYPLPYYVTYASNRYRHAIEPLMIALGAYFVLELGKSVQMRIAARHNQGRRGQNRVDSL